jgi:hypothetical protein
MLINKIGSYANEIQTGLELARLPEAEGGWAEYFAESEEADLQIKDDRMRGMTALMLENTKHWMARKCRGRIDEAGRMHINEVTRSALLGGFSDYIFPIIRAGFPTNPINDIVSVQPTNRRTATVVYWNFVVGRGKGSYYQGQRLFDALHGKQDAGFNFSNEVIDAETLATTTAPANAVYTGTLTFHDGGGVRPGTVKVTAETTGAGAGQEFFDNGNGGWTSTLALTAGANTYIDYSTGEFSIELNADTFVASLQPVATYRWDSEGSSMVPQIDVQITQSTVETERRAIMVNYSIESVQDLMAEFGVQLEPNLVSAAAEQMNFEIARQIIHELWTVAPVAGVFPTTNPGSGYSQQEHFRDIIFLLNTASNNIWSRTQKVYGNWLIVDKLAANVIESLPGDLFVKAPKPKNPQGLHFIGTLAGEYRVYKDIHLDKEPGAAPNGNILMGFKGQDFYEAGFVWAPYRLLYTTETLTTADFLSQKGMASRYATKMVNPDMYVRINLGP